jgi:hypothetical protein
MEHQYHSMKRVLSESDKLLKIAYDPDNNEWKNIDIDKQCILSVRSNKTLMELKSRVILDLSMKNTLIIAYLIKHYPECLPFCKEAVDIKQPTELEKLGFIRLSIPIPFIKDRSTELRGIGFQQHKKTNMACIYAEGITENKEFFE